MTQLTTFEEFVEVVKANPTLRTQLFEALGLLTLGAAQQEAITELVALRKDVDGLVTRVDGLDVKVDGLVTRVDGLDVKVDGLVTRVDGLDAKVDGLATDVHSLNTKVDGLATDVHSLNSVVLGGELEEKASNVVYSQLRSLASAKLRAITLRHSTRRSLQPDNESYTSPMEDAVGSGIITETEETRLIRTDLAFSASVETAEGWRPAGSQSRCRV